MEPQAYYKPSEAARFARVGETTIRAAYRSGALRVRYVTSRPVISHEDLIAWIESAPTREQRVRPTTCEGDGATRG